MPLPTARAPVLFVLTFLPFLSLGHGPVAEQRRLEDAITKSPTPNPTTVKEHACYTAPNEGYPWEHRFEVEGNCVPYDHDLTWVKKDNEDGDLDYALCRHLIDYDYYLDVDSTQQDYEEYLRWEFYNSSTSALVIPLLNRECQKTYKKVICANHFRRCVTGDDGNAKPLPVCRSEADEMLVYKSKGGICEAAFVGSLGERAILPTLFATGEDYVYNGGDTGSYPENTHVYSTSEEEAAGQCTKIDYVHSEFGEWDVQDSIGKYNGTLCEGIIDEYFVPPTVHPFQSPEYHSEILEGKAWNISLEGILEPVSPFIMPTKCQTEWKKFACGAVFMRPELVPIYGDWGGELNAGGRAKGPGEPGGFEWVFAGDSAHPDGGTRSNKILAHLWMPQFLHQDQCQTMVDTCANFIEYANEQREEDGEEPLDICGAKIEGVSSAFDGKPQFPDEELPILVSLGGPEVEMCNEVIITAGGLEVDLIIEVYSHSRMLDYHPFNTTAVVQELSCPFPLVIPPPNKADASVIFTGCAIPCPKPYWPHSYHIAIKWYLTGVAWVCFIAISYTVFTFCYFKRLRKQRQTLIFSGCTWMMCWSQVMMSFWSADFHHLCTTDNINTIEQSDGFTICLFQSMTLMYFATGCTYWWLLVAMELFMKVHNKLRWKPKFKTQFIIAQGLPVLWCTYFYGMSAMGNQALHLCWVNKLGVWPPAVSEDNPEGYVNNIDKPWYFATMTNLIVGLTMMFMTMAKIARVDKKASNKSKEGSTKGGKKGKLGARQKKTINVYMKKWRLYKTSVYFIVLYVGLFIVICSYRFIEASDDNQNAVTDSATDWAKCLFENFPERGYDPIEEGDCPDGPSHKPAIFFMAALMTFVICLGFGMYVIYGSKKEYVKMWKNELAAKGLVLGGGSAVQNASNVNGTICSSRAGEDGSKNKKKKGFFNNSVASSAMSNGGSSAMSSSSSTGSSTAVEDEKPDPNDYIPPRHVLNKLKKKEKEMSKLDSKYGVYAQTEAVEEIREDKTAFTVHIGASQEWAIKVPTSLEATEGAANDMRNVLYLMAKASAMPELQGWICSKYTYDPTKGAQFMKPIIEAQDKTQALLGIKYHWNSGDFLWLKQKSDTQVDCHKMVAEDIDDVAHSFDPTPLLKECEQMSLEDVHKMFRAVCDVDISCPYW